MRHCLRAKSANDTVVDIDIDSSIEDIRQWDTKLPIHSPCQKTQPCLSMDPHMFKSFKKEKETNRNTSPFPKQTKEHAIPNIKSSPCHFCHRVPKKARNEILITKFYINFSFTTFHNIVGLKYAPL